jgi:hypothetical protein
MLLEAVMKDFGQNPDKPAFPGTYSKVSKDGRVS